jgi:Family of unknown function (DUF6226)
LSIPVRPLAGLELIARRAVGPNSADVAAELEQADAVDDEWEEPPPEAYGRVTNPERFELVVAEARLLVDELATRYDVRREAGSPAEDFPQLSFDPDDEVVRLVPTQEGAGPLAVRYTRFPGVFTRMGHAVVEAYPSCGCDACSEDPTGLIAELRRDVDAYVTGGMTETISRNAHEHHLGSGSGWSRLDHGEWRRYGPLGTTHWLAWAARAGST